ncbi:MAG: aldose 1-epimerase family protein [Clostridia bacterium]|nr:aldose 1-epimerase family protein [Clostridia bacterium]
MNIYTISNDYLTVKLSEIGGEPISIVMNGHEYLWHRDPAYWKSSAPLLFPAVGRLRGGEWTDGGRSFAMGTHGFARHQKMSAVALRDYAEFTLKDNAETHESYPYSFSLRRRFKLAKNALLETVTVSNTDDRNIYFGIGLHPGFMLPEGRARLSLECSDQPERQLLSPRFFMADQTEPYPLSEGRYIEIDNSLFDNDAIILSGIKTATLESPDSERSVTVSFPDANYVGFWQPMNTDAPFLCIEPWQSLPASDAPEGTPADEISERKGFIELAPGKSYCFNCAFIFK